MEKEKVESGSRHATTCARVLEKRVVLENHADEDALGRTDHRYFWIVFLGISFVCCSLCNGSYPI